MTKLVVDERIIFTFESSTIFLVDRPVMSLTNLVTVISRFAITALFLAILLSTRVTIWMVLKPTLAIERRIDRLVRHLTFANLLTKLVEAHDEHL